MLTLYYAPNSRASRILTLLEEMNIRDEVSIVLTDIPRVDGSGHRDPANPHAEGKVPLLVTEDGEEIRESNAIMLYLTDRFGACGRGVGEAGRGTYLSWMTWYGNVFEPVYVVSVAEADSPVFNVTWRGVAEALAVLEAALSDGRSYLMGEDITAADLIIASTFLWFGAPDVPVIAQWVARCAARDSMAKTLAFDTDAVAEMAGESLPA